MAKKFVRGITDVKTINNQDFDTNNVNDLLSDGQYNYIHRKKGEVEEYHNLTDNIKTLSSDNTELLSVTNNNKTTNSATLHPKHDKQKEQVLESTRNTVAISHGANGTAEKTTVDTNPKKVLEHENLISNSQYVTIEHEQDSNISKIKTDKLDTKLDELNNKIPKKVGGVNLFKDSRGFTGTDWIGTAGEYAEDYQGVKIFKKNSMWSGRTQYFEVKAGEEYVFSAYVKSSAETDKVTFILTHPQKEPQAAGIVSIGSNNSQNTINVDLTNEYQRIAIKIKITKDGWIAPRIERSNTNAYLFYGGYKFERYNVPTDYSPNPEDVYPLLAQKQNTIKSNASIAVNPDGLRQLYALRRTYNHANGILKTYIKAISQNTTLDILEQEYNFILKINQGTQDTTFTLSEHDKNKFGNIITAYGVDGSVRINGCLFTLSDNTLTVSTEANTGSNLVISFSDII